MTREAQTAVALLEKEGMSITRPDTADFRKALAPTFKKFEAQFGPDIAAIQRVQ